MTRPSHDTVDAAAGIVRVGPPPEGSPPPAFPYSDPARYDRGVSREITPFVEVYVQLSTCDGVDVESIELAIAASLAATPERLRVLAEAVDDPLAWAPLLQRLLLVPPEARGRNWHRAFAHLHGVVQQLLDEDGATVLRPEDVLLRPGVVQRLAARLWAA